jgi:opacity protein-like surface antigen
MSSKWVIGSGLALYCMITFADNTGGTVIPVAIGIPETCTSVVSLSGGPAFYQHNQRHTIVIEPTGLPGIINRYVDSPLTRVLGSAELFFGLGRPIFNQGLSGELGLILAYSGEGTLNGSIHQNASGSTNNLTYKYKMTNSRVGFRGKLIADLGYRVSPYISASGSAGFNRSYDYLANGANLGAIPTPNFNNNTELAFSYTAGFGIQAPITPNWHLGLGYEFDDWGKNSLNITTKSRQDISPSINTLPQTFFNKTYQRSNFFTHKIQFSLSYIL